MTNLASPCLESRTHETRKSYNNQHNQHNQHNRPTNNQATVKSCQLLTTEFSFPNLVRGFRHFFKPPGEGFRFRTDSPVRTFWEEKENVTTWGKNATGHVPMMSLKKKHIIIESFLCFCNCKVVFSSNWANAHANPVEFSRLMTYGCATHH